MSKLDTNGDGKIDYSEFITAAVNRAQILSKENLDITFKIFDSDGNGKISVEELKAIFSGGTLVNEDSEETKSVWLKIMQEVDTDNDGNYKDDGGNSIVRAASDRHKGGTTRCNGVTIGGGANRLGALA